MADKNVYEIHITLEYPERVELRNWLEHWAPQTGWKTSFIDGDPILGEKRFFYYTRYAERLSQAHELLEHQVQALRDHGEFKILREKIEKIVYDVRHDNG